MHSSLSTCHHVAITLGGRVETMNELQQTLDKYLVAALLVPAKRPREEGSNGTQKQGSRCATGSQEKAPKRTRK